MTLTIRPILNNNYKKIPFNITTNEKLSSLNKKLRNN